MESSVIPCRPHPDCPLLMYPSAEVVESHQPSVIRAAIRFAAILALGLTLGSCAGPRVRVEDPLEPGWKIDLQSRHHKLESPNQETLREENLIRTYNRDPSVAIATLLKRYRGQPSHSRRLALAEMVADTGDELAQAEPVRAIGHYLDAARLTDQSATSTSQGRYESLEHVVYKASTARVARLLHIHNPNLPRPLHAEGAINSYKLTLAKGKGYLNPSQLDLLVPAQWLKFRRIDLKPVAQVGLGAAMVGRRSNTFSREHSDPLMPSSGYWYALNARLSFAESHATLTLQDLLVRGAAEIGGRVTPLAGDFRAPLAFAFQERKNRGREILAMLRPARFENTIELYALEPFREDKIPLILVHGLLSSAESWYPLVNQLRKDPFIRERYQILLFNYPTGNPIGLSARELRNALKLFWSQYAAENNPDAMNRAVMIGHSMGGILTNLHVRSSGDRLTKKLLDDKVPSAELEGLKSLLVFQADACVTSAIMIAAPHRGSEIASSVIGSLGSWLIRLPFDVVDSFLGEIVIVDALTDVGQAIAGRPQDSVASLRPDNPVLEMFLELPVSSRATLHSIIAQKQKRRPLLESTDGVVPYPSAHLAEAKTELVVSGADHNDILEREECIEEVIRLLYRNAGKAPPRDPK